MPCSADIHNISPDNQAASMYQEYGDKTAADVAETDILVLDEMAYVADAVRAMKKKGVSSVLVSRAVTMRPVGIITERDILYRVVAEHRSPFKTVLRDVMSSPLVTIDHSAPVRDAVALMRKHGIRRLPIVKEGRMVGMLTLKSVMGNSHEKSVDLIDIEVPAEKVVCPYCQSRFESKQELSKHIDRLHLGSGLLEGDLRQW